MALPPEGFIVLRTLFSKLLTNGPNLVAMDLLLEGVNERQGLCERRFTSHVTVAITQTDRYHAYRILALVVQVANSRSLGVRQSIRLAGS